MTVLLRSSSMATVEAIGGLGSRPKRNRRGITLVNTGSIRPPRMLALARSMYRTPADCSQRKSIHAVARSKS